jgi:dihydropyrimidinase
MMPPLSRDGCDLAIVGGTVVTPDGTYRADIEINDGVITRVGEPATTGSTVVDAKGMLVLPGGIDGHTHLNSAWPSMGERKPADDFSSGTRAAAAGGITTIGDFVYALGEETLPEAVERVQKDAEAKTHVDFTLHIVVPTLRDGLDAEVAALVESGYPSVKVYMQWPDVVTNGANYIRLLALVARLGGLAMFHCEDRAILEYSRQAFAESGRTAVRYYPASKPVDIEVAATAQALSFAAVAQIPAYIVHLSCAAALDQVLAARARGAQAFVETRPLYLHLTDDCFDSVDPEAARYVGTPPLRGHEDVVRLWKGLSSGQIDVVGSDHVGFTIAQKYQIGDTFETVPKGVANMETMLPMLFSEGVKTGRLTLERFVEVIATGPARIFGLYPQKGVIAVGSDADFCILDPSSHHKVAERSIHGLSDFDVFAGREIFGWPAYTISRGEIIFQDGHINAQAGRGRLVRGKRIAA